VRQGGEEPSDLNLRFKSGLTLAPNYNEKTHLDDFLESCSHLMDVKEYAESMPSEQAPEGEAS
jgi:hypothetical protein